MLPWFEWTTIQLGPLPIQVWGLFVALGMLLSVYILYKRANYFGINAESAIDQAIWMIVLGFVGARLFHIFLYEPVFYLTNPIEVLKIWHGGLSSFGGIAGALLGFFITRKKLGRKIRLLSVADLYTYAALYGWMIGRVGCVMIHDHLGMQCGCALALDKPDGPRLDMALLEILGLLPLAIIFFVSRRKQKPAGWFFAFAAVYYGILRFVLDFFRANDIPNADARYVGLTPAQYFAILLVFIGGHVIHKFRSR